MRNTLILTAMFAVLFLINLITLFGVCRTKQGNRVIFAFKVATALTFAAAFICLIVTVSLYLGGEYV